MPAHITGAILIGVDLGPNLSVLSAFATTLRLIAPRREGTAYRSWQFLRLGLVRDAPALLVALLAL